MVTKTTVDQANVRELERFRQIYPMLKFELDGIHLTVQMGANSSYHTTMEQGRVDHESTMYIEKDNMQLTMSHSLMARYPDLYISINAGKDGCLASVWINRPNDKGEADDAEGMGHLDVVEADFHTTLRKWQKEAKKAKQKGWFFCTGHVRAEPMSEYGYFYFAGKFCKQYGIDNPEHNKMAGRETYN